MLVNYHQLPIKSTKVLNLPQQEILRRVCLDISKVFDKVWHEGLLLKLQSYEIEDSLLTLLQNYLTVRQQKVVLKGQTSLWLNVSTSVPQGSVLGPLLFLIYINDLPDEITSSCKIFGDDTLFFFLN